MVYRGRSLRPVRCRIKPANPVDVRKHFIAKGRLAHFGGVSNPMLVPD